MSLSDRVIIGMGRHKRSATIEVMAGDETVVGRGRFDTDRAGFAVMVAYVKQWPNRVWAIEGCEGIGRHIATRLLADGEPGRRRSAEAVRPGAGLRHRAGP